MLDNIEIAFRSVLSALQIAKLYSTQHVKYRKFLDKAYDDLRAALAEHGELVIGIIGDELAFEKEILFDLSKAVRPMIAYLKQREIERISFLRTLTKEELDRFISFLMLGKEEMKREMQKEDNLLSGLQTISAGKIKRGNGAVEGKNSELESAVNYLNLYNSSLDNVTNSLESVLNAKSLDNIDLKFNVNTIFENLIARHQELLKLAVVKRFDMSTFVHILNVAILSMYFSSKLGFAKEEVLEIGIAALFHDIGKMYISRKIIKKTDRLTDAEFDSIRSHSVLGAELLLEYVDNLGMLPVIVSFEHHLRADGKGYPRMAFPHTPHIASQIVSVCDVYDALFERRSYKNSYPANVIYAIMTRDRAKYYDPELLDIFFKFLGVWPIGTIVLLNDRRIAVVRDENEDDPFCPIVEVIAGPGIAPDAERKIIDLREDRERLRIDRSLDPNGDGEEYKKLV
jgi:putative nucleotidyltransferase with HDIG domain